ncbi:ATP-binding protein [Pseudothermotoga thermarum]|uniref:ATPase-like protein n=1 Tax=Pseudothermotoga thermarum DSM 5069 TaxID=688269 RepID=F7YXP7_9THEM|nr:ATP-binding protein [Pseudothermotoga thermarum]AEH50691.1 hypothetical protein Theth_0603 [Pseudothermotoga thermarum DSM 5069]
MKRIGVVTGSNTSSPYVFYVRLEHENNKPVYMPQIDDVVKVIFEYKPHGEIVYYGVITQLNAKWDFGPMSGYEEDVALKGLAPAFGYYLATVITTRMLLKRENDYIDQDAPQVPPPPGTPVFLAAGEEMNTALGFDELVKENLAVPVGIMRNGSVAYLDVRYILGENGAHINISGQSGVAAKTSYATFLMKSFLDTGKRLSKYNPLMKYLENSRFIVFNVKGEGLMFLDKWSKDWKNNESNESGRRWKEMYEKLKIKPEPFEKVLFYFPRKQRNIDEPWSFKRIPEPGKVFTYGWDAIDIIRMNLLELMFDQDELEANQNLQLAVTTLQEILQEKLEKAFEMAKKFLEDDGEKVPPSMDPTIVLRKAMSRGLDVKLYANLPDGIDDLIEMVKNDQEVQNKIYSEVGSKATVSAMIRRLKAAKNIGMDLVWIPMHFSLNSQNFESHNMLWDKPGQVTVFDISKLRPRVQTFVVGATLVEILKSREEKSNQDPVFIFLDELNKYAPRHGGGPLKNIFRDIAERGRSFRIILIGAEQTASEVDYRVITQSSTTVVGRQKAVELEKPEYGHLTLEQKQRAALLQQGEVIVDQPFLRLPITVKFPLPAWCTREDGAFSYSEEEREETKAKLFG